MAGNYPWASGRLDADEGPVITFQRRGSSGADIRLHMRTNQTEWQAVYLFEGVGSPYHSQSGYFLPLGDLNDGAWHEISLDIQEIFDNLNAGETMTEAYSTFFRGDVAHDTIRIAPARTTRIYTLLPSALGGIISIRTVGGSSYYDVTNTNTWYAYDRLGSVCLTTDAAAASNGLAWQGAYGGMGGSADMNKHRLSPIVYGMCPHVET
jgi:hypothetical protein